MWPDPLNFMGLTVASPYTTVRYIDTPMPSQGATNNLI